MTATPSPYAQMALSATLCGPIARYFATRPSLREVAGLVIETQWRERRLAGPAPAQLLLYRWAAGSGYRVDTLVDALIERLCQDTPLRFAKSQDFVSTDTGAEFPHTASTDLDAVETLLNECGPFLLDEYKHQLVAYWGQDSAAGPAPWRWLAAYLRDGCRTAARLQEGNGTLDSLEAATALVMADRPEASQRVGMDNLAATKASLLSLDVHAQSWIDPELASALLIERPLPEQQRSLTLLYTLAGRFLHFDSPMALLRMLAFSGGRRGSTPFNLHLFSPQESVFLVQAVQALEQQLAVVDRIAGEVRMRASGRVNALVRQLDEATSFLQVCEQNQYVIWSLYFTQLPVWLQQASRPDREAFGKGLMELATVQQQTGAKSFLDGLQSILEYAQEQVRDAILVDHPQVPAADVDAIDVINKRVTAGAAGNGGSVAAQGSVQTVRMSLAQFALENLSALRAGSVSLEMHNGSVLPAWLTLDYVKALVMRLNLGERYPAMLRQALLDDPQAKDTRLPLFTGQIRQQLPLLALEKKLCGTDAMTTEGVRLVNGVFHPEPGEPDFARLCPVAFIRRRGATADVALNAYLLERFDLQGACVLYRPLHREPLRQFESRDAFIEAVQDDQVLQDDLLARLDEHARPIYAKGGFAQPHIVRFVPGAEFGPVEIPAPATLSEAAVAGNVLEHLYLNCAHELVARADAQSRSNDEDRWVGYQELGWLMFNTLLPVLNGPLAVSSWMLQVFSILRNDLLQAPPQDDHLVSSLFNLAALLVVFPGLTRSAASATGTPETVPEATAETAPEPPVIEESVRQPTSSPSGAVLAQMDFSWTAMGQRLSSDQRASLLRFKVEEPPETHGAAVAEGPWKGLYHHEGRWWAQVEDAWYEVRLAGREARIVDPFGQPGPWLQEQAPGVWRFNTQLRLRGGMPINRRIEQLRAANRLRLTELEHQQRELLTQRLQLNLVLERDLDDTAAQERPSVQLMKRYGDHLREHDRLLGEIDDNYTAYNQLKSLPEFNQVHAQVLLERAASLDQLLFVLRSQLVENKLEVRVLQQRIAEEEGDVSARPQRYEQLLTVCEQGKNIIDEAVRYCLLVESLVRQLEKVLPMGPAMIAKFAGLHGTAPSLWSWRSSQVSMSVILILAVEQLNSLEWYEAVRMIRLGLQMQLELETAAAFTASERAAILDSSVSKYSAALETLGALEAELVTPRGQLWFAAFASSLQNLKREAEEALAGIIRSLPSEPETPVPSADRSQVVIKTRRRGTVVARRRASKSGRIETVVLDSLEDKALAHFEESSEPGIWNMVESPELPAPQGTSLRTLLKRCQPLLTEAEKQVARARSQARTATIGIEMEEILINQARPLEQLVQQIEDNLTQHNEVDSQAVGRDAAIEAKALRDKAQAMREEGRQLRITITKKQLPAPERVAWLKAQDQIVITRPKGREASARRKGKPQDYLQEYVISDKAGQPLWYAHFHYASLEAPGSEFTAAHLKTREQRFDAGHYQVKTEKSSQKVIEIYRSRIDKAASELFLGV